jgi:hypothetical protein
MEILREYWQFLIPIVVIELALMITALRHILTHSNYRVGNRTLWVVLVVVLQIIGPLLYFVIGRADE